METTERWQNQEEAFQFSMSHPAVMLDMDMGTGKTRVAIDVAFARSEVHRILVVCPKVAIPVWRENLMKFRASEYGEGWQCWDDRKGKVSTKAESAAKWLNETNTKKQFVVMNYDIIWRTPMSDTIVKSRFDMVILDESHRAKAAGSKTSRFLAIVGRRVKYKMCLSGTPMANSPLDVYGQYRFLDQDIFGTNHGLFLQEFAIMGGPERRFIVGYKNQAELNRKFRLLAYSCKMSEVKDEIKLPDALPPIKRSVQLPSKDMQVIKSLNKEFLAECESGFIAVNNVLTKLVRLQQISSGFCFVQESVFNKDKDLQELNTAKRDELCEIFNDISITENVVVFCIFTHDIESIKKAAEKMNRQCFEISGARNQKEEWKSTKGAVLAVQIQAGAESIDMTIAHHAIYFSLPHSLFLYEQSKSRLYRPGQTRPVSFIHLIAERTIDEALYKSLLKKEDIIDAIKSGTFNAGYIKW